MALIGTLTSGVSALKVFSKDLEVIGDNIANVNTTAFKSGKVSITDDFSNTLRASQPGNGSTISNVQSAQIGTGVKISGINTNFTQGVVSSTGSATDLAVSGNGYFLVKDGTGDTLATRAGSFRWDDQGYLVNAAGMRVQGLKGDYATGLGTAVGDIKKDTATQTNASGATITLKSVAIDRSGQVVQFYSDGSNKTVGQVLVQQFNQPSSLMKRGDGLYTSLNNAGPIGNGTGGTTNQLFTTAATLTAGNTDYVAGSSGNGTIEAESLELSNVDLTEQFAAMITAQRSFQAASRLVTVSDSVLEDIVNLKR